MNVPKYPSSEESIHVGDRIAFGDRTARIVIVTHTGEYAEDFPRAEWAFVPPGTIAVQFDLVERFGQCFIKKSLATSHLPLVRIRALALSS